LRVPAISILAALAAIPFAAVDSRAQSLRVHPVVSAEMAEQLGRDGLPIRGVVASPAQREIQHRRASRWRSFPDRLSHPGVNWSPDVMRRRDWQPPAGSSVSAGERAPGALSVAGTPTPPDTLRVAFIRIDFLADRGGPASTGDGRFDLSGPDTLLAPIDRPPHNRTFYQAHGRALARYFDAQTYGRVVVEPEVWPRDEDGAYSTSDMADFGPWLFSQSIYRDAVTMFRTFMFAADSQSIERNDRIPWHTYDRIVLIHAGSDLQSDLRQDSAEDIPSFTIGVVDTDLVVFRDVAAPGDSVVIDRAAIVPETANQDGYYGAINGVLAHECGHLFFNFADLYDVNTGRPVVGFWSLMDSGNLVGSIVEVPGGDVIFATGLLPPSLDPFHRFYSTDALAFPEVSYGDTTALLDSERHPDMRRVTLSSDEYLILENRYLAPAAVVELDQDSLTRIVLGPKSPDRYEYDALLPGGGIVVWHIDESVIPFETSLRINPDFGWNTNPTRLGVAVVEADGLQDLGDLGSPLLFGAPYDPWFLSNNATLSDSTIPPLAPHTGTRPNVALHFLDEAGPTMRFSAFRTRTLAGWPVDANFPPGGPVLLAVDADGDRSLEICWAGGSGAPADTTLRADSTALFAVRANGRGLNDSTAVFMRLDRRPRREMAAIPIGEYFGPGIPQEGPAYFAVTTYADGPDTTQPGGRAWVVTRSGNALPGWPAALPAIATTPPVVTGIYPNVQIFVGCADGRVYALDLAGEVLAVSSPPLPGPAAGPLAVWSHGTSLVFPGAARATGAALPGAIRVAATGGGSVSVFGDGTGALAQRAGWPRALAAPADEPALLWLDFGSNGAADIEGCGAVAPELVVLDDDRLWAYCEDGRALSGWGGGIGDSLVPALGAGDPDGDGFVEVLVQDVRSRAAFVNVTGRPSPGWPRRGSPEDIPGGATPLALDVNGDARSEVVALNGSGIVAALDADGRVMPEFPLASGAGATGSPVADDIDRDGSLDLVVPDRFGRLYGYRLSVPLADARATSWTVWGGDVGRASALSPERSSFAPAPMAGPLVAGSLKAFPNPARRRPVNLAFQLLEPADVEVRVLDASGHEVASFTRAGNQADNLVVWEPGNLPSGLYLVRVRIRGGGGEHVSTVPVGLLR
jgi:M6 family metalloprotease-like protein